MQRYRWALVVVLVFGLALPAAAQFKEDDSSAGKTTGKSAAETWRFGMIYKATGGACRPSHGYVPIPTDWPEQQVQIVAEDLSTGARIRYEMVDGGVKIMKVNFPQLSANAEAKALITLEMRRNEILPPENTDIFVLPDLKKLPGAVRRYLQPSPMIESRDPKIRELAKEIGVDKEHAWDRVEAIFDWVRGHVKYKTGELKGALAALRDRAGDCEELTSLFIAICRAGDIPARTVWVPGHCYPEFYLNDDKGEGHWFPCQIAAEGREFGGITDLRPILQKGDSFRPARSTKTERQRYMAESFTITPVSKNDRVSQPNFIREPVAKQAQ
jgi:hypothetical protein